MKASGFEVVRGEAGARRRAWRRRAGGWLAAGWLLAAGSTVMADLEVTLKAVHTVVLQYEPMLISLRIRNDTFYPFVLEAGNTNTGTRLRVTVMQGDRPIRFRNGELPMERIALRPGEVQDVSVDISRWFDVSAMGGYLVHAAVDWDDEVYRSNKIAVDVVSGVELKLVNQSIAGYPERVRRYSLRYWVRDRKEHLFLRVDEPGTGVNYGVMDLGTLVRVIAPTLDVDRSGRIRVVHQSARDRFTRTVFMSSLEGIMFIDRRYHGRDGQPYPEAGEGAGPR